MFMVLIGILGITFFSICAINPNGTIHDGSHVATGMMFFAIALSILATILASHEFITSIIKYKKLCKLFESLEHDLQSDLYKGSPELKEDYEKFNSLYHHLYYHTIGFSRLKKEKIDHKYKVINWIYYGKLHTR